MTEFRKRCRTAVATLIAVTTCAQEGMDAEVLDALSLKENVAQVEENDTAQTADGLKLFKGYNAFQTGLTDDGTARFKLYSNIGVQFDEVHLLKNLPF